MKIIIAFIILSYINASPKFLQHPNINGNWQPINQEIGKIVLPKSSFTNHLLTILDSNYTYTAESIDKGILKYNNLQMDIYGQEGINSGKHFKAIYKCENQLLIICYNLMGDYYPDAFQTKGNPHLFLSVFKRK